VANDHGTPVPDAHPACVVEDDVVLRGGVQGVLGLVVEDVRDPECANALYVASGAHADDLGPAQCCQLSSELTDPARDAGHQDSLARCHVRHVDRPQRGGAGDGEGGSVLVGHALGQGGEPVLVGERELRHGSEALPKDRVAHAPACGSRAQLGHDAGAVHA
jgi:hypothetical protein